MYKFSYGLGMNIGQNLASMGVSTLEFADFVKGMQDVLSGKQTEITVVEAQNAINDFFNKLTEEKYGKTKESGIAFLEENKKREGVVTLPSGLQYEIINAGLGKKPTAADRVQCHYEGTLIDGTVFDSSIKRGQPAVFGVSQVIAGWVEALQLMGEGSKWRLYIPYDLAYGANGAPGAIPPYATLKFVVELIEVL